MDANKAATIIQRAWKRYTDKRLFRFYKELINFHEKGDPAQLLKGIAPSEAELLDPAVSACVRFRLGGSSFPPMIFFKIFIKAPLCNVNSFAPRDYTKPFIKSSKSGNQRKSSKSYSVHAMSDYPASKKNMHSLQTNDAQSESQYLNENAETMSNNRSYSSVATVSSAASIRSIVTISESISDEQLEGLTAEDVEGWYCRDEDQENSWRPVNEKGYKQMIAMSPMSNSSYLLHHSVYNTAAHERRSRLISKAERTRQKKERAIQWMLKAAKLDQEQRQRKAQQAVASSSSSSSSSSSFSSSSSSSNSNNNNNPFLRRNKPPEENEEEKDDVDDLINWADELDYASYLTEWGRIGTSETSDAGVIRREEMKKIKEALLKRIEEEERQQRKEEQASRPFTSSTSHPSTVGAPPDTPISFDNSQMINKEDNEMNKNNTSSSPGRSRSGGKSVGGVTVGGRAGLDFDNVNDPINHIYDALGKNINEPPLGLS